MESTRSDKVELTKTYMAIAVDVRVQRRHVHEYDLHVQVSESMQTYTPLEDIDQHIQRLSRSRRNMVWQRFVHAD